MFFSKINLFTQKSLLNNLNKTKIDDKSNNLNKDCNPSTTLFNLIAKEINSVNLGLKINYWEINIMLLAHQFSLDENEQEFQITTNNIVH